MKVKDLVKEIKGKGTRCLMDYGVKFQSNKSIRDQGHYGFDYQFYFQAPVPKGESNVDNSEYLLNFSIPKEIEGAVVQALSRFGYKRIS